MIVLIIFRELWSFSFYWGKMETKSGWRESFRITYHVIMNLEPELWSLGSKLHSKHLGSSRDFKNRATSSQSLDTPGFHFFFLDNAAGGFQQGWPCPPPCRRGYFPVAAIPEGVAMAVVRSPGIQIWQKEELLSTNDSVRPSLSSWPTLRNTRRPITRPVLLLRELRLELTPRKKGVAISLQWLCS